MKVDNRKDNNVGVVDAVEDTIGELAQDCSPYVAVYNLILNRIAGKSIKDSVGLAQKLASESRLLRLIPSHASL